MSQLHAWAQEHENYGFALSNPKFEYWLLLHFEDGKHMASSKDCSQGLKRYLPGYDKACDPRKFTRQGIADAIRRARLRDNPPVSTGHEPSAALPFINSSRTFSRVERLGTY